MVHGVVTYFIKIKNIEKEWKNVEICYIKSTVDPICVEQEIEKIKLLETAWFFANI